MLGRVRLKTPLGIALALVEGDAICALGFEDGWAELEARVLRRRGAAAVEMDTPQDVLRALDAYFKGELGALDRVNVRLRGTPFQERVWAAAHAIPPGTARTYGELAQAIGTPAAARAVGAANARNPTLIVVPCHRVVGADGGLVDYAGGLKRKRWLLVHEAQHGANRPPRGCDCSNGFHGLPADRTRPTLHQLSARFK